METAARITALVFISLVSLRTVLTLVAPGMHHRVASRFYTGKKKQPVYLLLAAWGATLLAVETSPVYLIIAYMTVGALYDYFFALFPDESAALIAAGEEHKPRLWLFAYLVPLGLLAALILNMTGVL